MKRYATFLGLTLLAAGCGLDNYEEPQSKLAGRVTYNGQPLGVRGTGEAVQLQLYQEGYELNAPIPVYVTQDGSFEALLFDGRYKLVTRDNNGPWLNERDTVNIELRGNAEIDVEVTPYFLISNPSISLSGSTVSASFGIEQVVEGAAVDQAMLLVSKTAFVDDITYVGRVDLNGLEPGNTAEATLDLSGNADFDSGRPLYGRIGLRPVGTDQAIYSPVVQLR